MAPEMLAVREVGYAFSTEGKSSPKLKVSFSYLLMNIIFETVFSSIFNFCTCKKIGFIFGGQVCVEEED
jgi:hypothetical protein